MNLLKKSRFKRGFKKWSDDKAIEFRKNLGLNTYDPLCAFELCKYLDIPLYTPHEIPGLGSDDIEVLLNSGSSHWSAVTIPFGKGKYIIIHNPCHSPERQQSNLMHEMAHIICGHEVSQEKMALGLAGYLRNFDEEHENEANWLGACLQLPRQAISRALYNGMGIIDISNHYNASIEMVNYRINITGLRRQFSSSFKK